MSPPSILGRWYAYPISPEEAERLVAEANRRLERRLRHRGGTLCCRLIQMQGRFWAGLDIREDFQSMQHIASRSAHGKALLELIYGQLLLCRKRRGALDHLDKGFNLARNLFTPSDYFEVMNRHRQLRNLPLTEAFSLPSSLAQLLVTARVIERMEQPEKKRGEYTFDKRDTYG